MKFGKIINTKIGKIIIIEQDGKIIEIRVNSNIEKDIIIKDTQILQKTAKQLEEYFAGQRKTFDVPLNPKGTEFMKKVWTALCEIPYGEVYSYKQIAEKIGNPKVSRAVGMANHNNPIPIIIPCHRVVGSSGKLVGYALGLEMKNFLLELEKKNV